jgi:hypothetical protein
MALMWPTTRFWLNKNDGAHMEIYTEIPSAATREALKKLGEWLGNWRCCTPVMYSNAGAGDRKTFYLVGDTGIEPVTSSV